MRAICAQHKGEYRCKSFIDEEIVEAQRRTFAASIIMSLADEARSYKDPALRARVLARSADALWDVNPKIKGLPFKEWV